MKRVVRTVAIGSTFAGALVLGVALHENTRAFRRMARTVGNSVLAGLFEGKVIVGEVQSLSLGRTGTLRVADVEVTAPDGSRVVHAEEITGTIQLVPLLRSLASGTGPVVEITEAHVKSADVVLDVDALGPKIAQTFQQRASKNPTVIPSTPPGAGPVSEPLLHIRRATIGAVHVHGNIVPPALDADARALEANLTLEHDIVTIVLDRGDVVVRSPHVPEQRSDIVGTAGGRLAITLATTRLDGHVELVGSLGAIPVLAHASIAGDDVDASLDIARTEAQAVAAAFGAVPLAAPVEVHAKARGTLPKIAIELQSRLGVTEIDAKGSVTLRDEPAFAVDVDARHVDARAFGVDVPTDLTAKVHAEGAGMLGTFRVESEPGTVLTEKVPAMTIQGRLEADVIAATVHATEPGVTLDGTVSLARPTLVATYDLRAQSSSLRSLSRAPNLVGGAASVRARGTFDVLRQTLRANVSLTGSGLVFQEFSAKHLSANGTIAGPIRSPMLDVAFTGEELAITAKDKTPLLYPTAKGRAKIGFDPSPHVLDASIEVGSGDAAVTAAAETVHFRNGVIETRGLVITGLGAPLALDLRAGSGLWSIRAKSAGVDLKRAAALTGLKELAILPEGAIAELDVDVRQTPRGPDGRFDIVVRSEKALGAGTLVTEAHGTLDDGKLVGRAKVSAEGLGEIEITEAALQIPGSLDVMRTTGTIELRGSIDLSQGAALFGGDAIERVAGIASFEGRIERGDPAALPAVRATVRTKGLALTFGDPSSNEPSTEIEGVDAIAHVAWDGRTDDAEIAVVSWDRGGLLASAGAKAKLPLARWASGAERLDGKALGKLEGDFTLDVPNRSLVGLPAFLRPPNVRGQMDARLHASGSIAHPQATIHVATSGLRIDRHHEQTRSFEPLDGTVDGRWDGEQAAITVALDERERRRGFRPPPPPDRRNQPRRAEVVPGRFRALVLLNDMRVNDVLAGVPLRSLPWRASTEIELENLNLAGLPIPGDIGITGALSGRLSVKDVHASPSFEARAHITGFGAGGAKVESVDVNVGGRDASLFAHASIVDASTTQPTKGTFQLASQSLRLQGIHVDWDPKAPTRLDYAIENGRLALLAPIVRSSVSELSGRADGAGSISIDADGEVFEGGLAVSDGRLYVNTLGEEITGASGVARFEKSGTWKIDDAVGKMGTGEFHATANGRLKGFSFVDAEATITAPKGIPLSSESATFAEATGEVKLTAKMSEDRRRLLVTVDVPKADIQLPDRGTQQLEPLEPDAAIVVGVRRKKGELDASAVRKGLGGTGTTARTVKTETGEALAFRFTIGLGSDTPRPRGDKGEVHLEGHGLDVTLTGRTVVDIADELGITGRIDLKGGTIEVHGRRFSVDRGAVTFPDGGDPGNPTVVAAAYWDAPDRTRVWVEFAGPLKTGSLTLRSEPSYSKNEILSVLLFGRPDPNMATGKSDKTGDASGATAVGTGFVAGDLNRMLSEIDENLDIETDTLSGNRTRTKLGRSFFDRRLKVQIGYAPGRTYREPDTTYVFLNWQFIPKWSVVATRGDRGTSILDVLFQHRY